MQGVHRDSFIFGDVLVATGLEGAIFSQRAKLPVLHMRQL